MNPTPSPPSLPQPEPIARTEAAASGLPPAGPRASRWSTSTFGQFALTLLFSGLAVLADWYGPVIFSGHTLVLGVVFYWIALYTVGPRRALLVLAISTAILWTKWGQFYSAAIIALEGLWVGIFWRLRRNPLLADVAFWAFIGTPLSWFLYNRVYIIPRPSLEHALVIQPINGFIALWIAYMVLELLGISRTPGEETGAQKFSAFLLKRYLAFGTFPVLVAGLLAARTFEQRAMQEARENLRTNAHALAASINRRLAKGTSTVQQLAARHADDQRFRNSAALSAELDQARAQSDLFITMLAADPTGHVVAASGTNAPPPGTEPPAVPNVSDREYFLAPMADGKPHVSGVFRGRGLGHHLLVAISAPVTSRTGETLGVVEGSLEVGRLAELLIDETPGSALRIVLSDQARQVIASHDFDFEPLTPLGQTPLGKAIARPPNVPTRFTDEQPHGKVIFLSVNVPVWDTNWTLTVQREWSDVLQPVLSTYVLILAVAVLTALLASGIAAWSIRDLLHTWRDLIAFARQPSPAALAASPVRNLPHEFRELLSSLSQMARNLESEKRQREQLLAELELRVKERTRELEAALVLAQAADRARSAFLATVSHELRTPLTSIITGVSLLKMGDRPRAPIEVRTITALEKSSQVLMNVISDVLDYSKLEAGGVVIERRPFLPASVVTDIAAILGPNAKRENLELRTVCAHATDLVWIGDPQRLRQVLVNLAGNGLKFTEAGHVEIRSRVVEDPARGARRLYFTVQDTGPGIPPDQLGAIFQPFVQLESKRVRSQAGTGLGLTICRKLVVMMGGEIEVRSEVGIGATFEFWIPEGSPDNESSGTPRP